MKHHAPFLSGAGILLITLLASCAFPFQETESVKSQDISGRLSYCGIPRQGFEF
jgi:hypothetical protein